MNNPLRILQTMDRNLTQPVELTIFGRAALAPGFGSSLPQFVTTQDVDAILPLGWLEAEDEHLDFWEAQQKTNAELESEGLYITQVFRELEIILTPDWFVRRVPIPLKLVKLTVFRPSTLDLILTKMARADQNDLADIRFLLRQETFSTGRLRDAFASSPRARCARTPAVVPAGATESFGPSPRTRGYAITACPATTR